MVRRNNRQRRQELQVEAQRDQREAEEMRRACEASRHCNHFETNDVERALQLSRDEDLELALALSRDEQRRAAQEAELLERALQLSLSSGPPPCAVAAEPAAPAAATKPRSPAIGTVHEPDLDFEMRSAIWASMTDGQAVGERAARPEPLCTFRAPEESLSVVSCQPPVASSFFDPHQGDTLASGPKIVEDLAGNTSDSQDSGSQALLHKPDGLDERRFSEAETEQVDSVVDEDEEWELIEWD